MGNMMSRKWMLRKRAVREVNYLTPKKLFEEAITNNLIPIQSREHPSILPGMGKLPNEWLYQYQRRNVSTGHGSFLGSEKIVFFEKK